MPTRPTHAAHVAQQCLVISYVFREGILTIVTAAANASSVSGALRFSYFD